MKKIIFMIIILLVFVTSCDIWSDAEYIEREDNPIACFNEITDACGNENYKIPMPSSYMSSALPVGLEVNFDPRTPFIVKFSDDIDKTTATSESVIVLDGSTPLPAADYVLDWYHDAEGNTDESILKISHSSGSWNPRSTYVVILLNGLKSKEGLIFGKSKAWFLAISEFQIVDSDGKSTVVGLPDESARTLQALREVLAPQLDLLTTLLKISRFDILLMWSFKFRKPVACFKEDLSGCEMDPIPLPSDYIASAVPVNTHLNISKKDKFTLKFSDSLDTDTVKDNIIILKSKGADVSLLTGDDFTVSYDSLTSDGIMDTSRLYIKPTSSSWDAASQYLIIVKKGVKTSVGDLVNAPGAAFLSKMEESLFLDAELTTLTPMLAPLFTTEESIKDARTLEMIRLLYKPSLDALKAMLGLERSDIIMFWSVTLDEDYIISCFNSSSFAGCEEANDAPLPSDFIMAYEADGSHHLNLPTSDDDPMKPLIDAINTLDGWSISKEFSLTLSNDLDLSTVSTNLLNMPAEIPTLWVLKMGIDGDDKPTATPTLVEASFIDEWNTLKIKPLMKTWDETSTYLIVMTDAIKGKNGEKLVKPLAFSFMSEKESLLNEDGSSKYLGLASYDQATLNSIEGARLQFDAAYKALAIPMADGGLGLERENIVMMWTVTTQTVTTDMKNIALGIKANASLPKIITITEMIENSEIENHFSDMMSSYWMQGGVTEFDNVSSIALGTLTAPWMLDERNVFDVDKLGGNLSAGDFKNIPILIAFPTEETEIKADNKIILFQHGINDNKEAVLPILNTLTGMGHIVISMDLPLHGERSLDLTDVKDNFNSLRNEADGTPDASGNGFLGLNIFGTRDLIRQSVIEQIILTKTLKDIDFSLLKNPADASSWNIKFSTVDNAEISYFGFSLGTIIGNIFISVDDSIKSAVLNVGGGVLVNIIMDTKESISGGLFAIFESMGMSKGSKKLDDFLYLTQTVLDPADPINYKRDGLPLLLQKSIGDPVMPNSSTDDLAVTIGLVNPLTGQTSPNYKSYQMDDFDPNKLFWHSFAMIKKSLTVNEAARTDIVNFFTGQ